MANNNTFTVSAEDKALLDKIKATEAAKAEKKAANKIERSEKRAARQSLENFGFTLKDDEGITEYNKLGARIVKSSKFGRMIEVHRGHDNNAVYFAREIEGGAKVEIGANTRGKKCTKNIILVKNNRDTVIEWITAAFTKFNTFDEAVAFLAASMTKSGKAKFQSYDLDELNVLQQNGDKTAARLAKELGLLYTSKGIGGTTVIELGAKG
jgi:hypothetical protein